MPSKLPVLKTNTTMENVSKMNVIARANKRSVSKELEWLIEKHIENYENEHGKIETVITTTTDPNLSTEEKLKKCFELGMKKGGYTK